MYRTIVAAILLAITVMPLSAAERHIMESRVPEDQREAARSLASPLTDSPEIVVQGKALYEGKAGCATCHGLEGDGRGPGAGVLDPSPRDFRHHGFWRHRSEGEIFWTIKHGAPGTAMIAFGPVLSDEEIWTIIEYERTFAGEHGRRTPRHGMGGMAPGGGMGRRRGGPGCCDGDDR